ncbi:hypothetical protein Dimus_001332 [Dionaea muscipula]
MAKTRNQRTVASTSTNHPPSHHDTETDLIREEEVADITQDARNDPPPGDRNAQVAGENPPPTTPQVVPTGGSSPNLTPDVIQLLFQQQQQMQTLMNVLIEQRGAPVGAGGMGDGVVLMAKMAWWLVLDGWSVGFVGGCCPPSRRSANSRRSASRGGWRVVLSRRLLMKAGACNLPPSWLIGDGGSVEDEGGGCGSGVQEQDEGDVKERWRETGDGFK